MLWQVFKVVRAEKYVVAMAPHVLKILLNEHYRFVEHKPMTEPH
jgi:hypothetical protein